MSLYEVGTRIWLRDDAEGWIGGEIRSRSEGKDGSLVLGVVAENGTETTITVKAGSAALPPVRNVPESEAVDDLKYLPHLNEGSMLHAVRTRFASQRIYTLSGLVLIALNPYASTTLYSPAHIRAYSSVTPPSSPHLFSVAQAAHDGISLRRRDQTIIVSGESGAGKTVSARHVMRYFAALGQAGESVTGTEEQILATNPVMEAFGNAKTIRNDNSSRFGRYLEILFDANQNIVGARIRIYLLERSRLVYQPKHERNTHIFYQLCAGASPELRRELGIGSANEYHYLNQGGSSTIPGVDDAASFRATQKALTALNIPRSQQLSIFRLLAALLHLGNISISTSTSRSSDAIVSSDDPALLRAAALLGVPAPAFQKGIVKKQIDVARGEKIVTALSRDQAVVARDSVARHIYTCLFDWLVAVLNEKLLGEEARARASSFIGVLDIYGFEDMERNSFEQFCINYANEKLQQEFNVHTFKLSQEEYAREGINVAFIDFPDNQPCIDMIEGRLGLLSLIDEQSRLPSGSDAGLLRKLDEQLKPPSYKKALFGSAGFTIAHYALEVSYDVDGFLEKNRDAVPDEHLALLAGSTNDFLREVCERARGGGESAPDSRPASGGPARRGGAARKQPTLASTFKGSLASLMASINATETHYIRCIKPADSKRPWEFDAQKVLGQLRACGVLETIRISRAGYPSKMVFADFVERFAILVEAPGTPTPNLVAACTRILSGTVTNPELYALGHTKVFLRAGVLAHLEKLRAALITLITAIQARARAKIVRRAMVVERQRASEERARWTRVQAAARGIVARRRYAAERKEAEATRVREREMAEKENRAREERKQRERGREKEREEARRHAARASLQSQASPPLPSSLARPQSTSSPSRSGPAPPSSLARPPSARSTRHRGPAPKLPERTTSLAHGRPTSPTLDPRTLSKRTSRQFNSPFFLG